MGKLVDSEMWREILAYLRQRHVQICRQWFEQLHPLELNSGLLRVLTPNQVQQQYLQRKCLSQFIESAQAVTGALVAVRFVTEDEQPDEPHDKRSATSVDTTGPPHPKQTRSSLARFISADGENESHSDLDQSVISPDNTFESFVTGPGNELAYAASLAVADNPGAAYNPLFIHGGVGLGKTHLLQAICQSVLNRRPDTRICYLSCDSFINQFVDCVQRNEMSRFREHYREVDMLVIDDIHFLTDRERTQEEFFHTFNTLYQRNRQIVMSCDSTPIEIPKLEERLVSRFQWGLVTQVTRPSYETRVAIVRSKAKLRGLELPRDVVEFIASKTQSNVRELEGAVTTIQASGVLQNRPIDLNLAHQALGESIPDPDSAHVPLQDIIDTVTKYYGVKLSDLQSKRRHKSISLPRQVCMWLARQRTRYSLEEIGGYFGGRDHTTVMHSIKTVQNRVDVDPGFARETQHILSKMNRHAHSP